MAPERVAIPEWATKVAVRGLGKLPGRVWLWPVDGQKLVELDRRCGGHPQITRAEFRHCGVCARPLLADEAIERRLMDASGPGGRLLPCGPVCRRDTESGVWKKLNPTYRTKQESD